SSITGSFRALNQGYSSEYFSAAGDSSQAAPPVEDESPETQQKQITKMLNVGDLARFGSPSQPAEGDALEPLVAPSDREVTAGYDDDFSTRPTAERPVPGDDDDFSTRPTAE